jgi:cytochrome c
MRMDRLSGKARRKPATALELKMRRSIALAICLTAAAPSWASAADPGAGKTVFQSQCGVCHSPQAGRNMTGPSLFGLVGRPAGQVAGFHYSAANKSSALTWDPATLDRYLTSPREVVPHTIMTYGGLKDAQKRADLIAYLETLH